MKQFKPNFNFNFKFFKIGIIDITNLLNSNYLNFNKATRTIIKDFLFNASVFLILIISINNYKVIEYCFTDYDKIGFTKLLHNHYDHTTKIGGLKEYRTFVLYDNTYKIYLIETIK